MEIKDSFNLKFNYYKKGTANTNADVLNNYIYKLITKNICHKSWNWRHYLSVNGCESRWRNLYFPKTTERLQFNGKSLRDQTLKNADKTFKILQELYYKHFLRYKIIRWNDILIREPNVRKILRNTMNKSNRSIKN